VIGTADGIAGTVNSIGMDNAGSINGFINSNFIVLIATSNGICRFNYQNETMVPVPANASSRIFEATYRTEMMHDSEFCRCYQDTVEHYAAFDLITYTIFGGELWLGGNSLGHNLKSAFLTTAGAYDPNTAFVVYSNQFWATENGLFQNYWNASYTTLPGYPHNHYLSGVDISKITSIYGLLSFGDGLVRENLLVGSSQGLYFSNSKYHVGTVSTYSFYHASELGNKAINDICVNANSYATTNMANICEDGVWVAAVDGLYLLKPDYAPYINTTQQIQAIQFQGQADTVNQLQLCANTSVNATVNNYVYGGNLVQWYKDGQELPNESNLSLTITTSGDYYTVLYDPCSVVHFESNHLQVSVLAAPVFSFNYPAQLSYCDGSTAILTTDNNPIYHYRWYKDSVLNGDTTATLNTTLSGKYRVQVSECQENWIPSKEVQIDFIKVPQPVIVPDKPAYCVGDQAILSATVPLDTSATINWQPYQYRWYKNGVLTGDITPSLTVAQPGKYKVEVTACSGNWTASQDIQIDFINISHPVITADKAGYCIGDQASLSINFINDGTYTINWLYNGNVVTANQNKTSLTTNLAGSYAVNISSNLTACSQPSLPYALIFDTLPAISLKQTINTTLCDGQTVNLKASYSGGNIKWSTGETSDQIEVKHSGSYSAIVTTAAGCTAMQNITLQFLANPLLAIRDAALCQFTNQTITLTAPAGFVNYEWNGQRGISSFSTNKAGAVVLTVTDNNGCSASQTININSYCNDIHLPNTFTPNNDGINDTLTIIGLEGDPSVKVSVYNRYGGLVFQSVGYATPWNGTYKGKQLPTGVYYYIVSAREAKQVLSGSITIIY
jgi:gliding motility-associated-like protein